MEDTIIMVESTTGMIMAVGTKEEPVCAIPMNNMMPDSEFGMMFYDRT